MPKSRPTRSQNKASNTHDKMRNHLPKWCQIILELEEQAKNNMSMAQNRKE